MRHQSPEWLDCSEASANVSGAQDIPVRKATAMQHSLSSKEYMSAAEHASCAHEPRDEVLLDTCESPQKTRQGANERQAAVQGRVLRSSKARDLIMEQAGAKQPASKAADNTANKATPVQTPFSAAQAAPEDARAASAPALPVLAPSPPLSTPASQAQAAGVLQPSPVTPYTSDSESSGPSGADTPEDAANAMGVLVGMAEAKGMQASEAQAGARLEPANAGAAVRPGRAAAQKASAAGQRPVMQPAGLKQTAAMPARRASSQDNSRRRDLVTAHGKLQRSGIASRSALRSSEERGASIPVRACNMSLLPRDSLADLFALAPVAWHRAHSEKLDAHLDSAPQPAVSEGSDGGRSESAQAVLEMPGAGQKTRREQACRQRTASGLNVRAHAVRRREGRLKSQGSGRQRAVKQEPHAAHASEAVNLVGPPQRQINKELAMLQAEGVLLLSSLSAYLHVYLHTGCCIHITCEIARNTILCKVQCILMYMSRAETCFISMHMLASWDVT